MLAEHAEALDTAYREVAPGSMAIHWPRSTTSANCTQPR